MINNATIEIFQVPIKKKIKINTAEFSFTFKPPICAVLSLLNTNARDSHNPTIALHSL